MSDQEYVGVLEIAQLAKVGTPTVVNWRYRDDTFPRPVAHPKSGPVYDKHEIEAWLAATGRANKKRRSRYDGAQ